MKSANDKQVICVLPTFTASAYLQVNSTSTTVPGSTGNCVVVDVVRVFVQSVFSPVHLSPVIFLSVSAEMKKCAVFYWDHHFELHLLIIWEMVL